MSLFRWASNQPEDPETRYYLDPPAPSEQSELSDY